MTWGRYACQPSGMTGEMSPCHARAEACNDRRNVPLSQGMTEMSHCQIRESDDDEESDVSCTIS
ncbi:hypothetical protein [Acetobacterium sp. MES1]|uniref:hypothetical protein n=1 Tax=Acetobacterium sp. MES1 TaxID=1899015 RepID=UPI00257A8D29|nr:hypothetical protein [Acetobacterium sp. MES1]